LIFQANPKDWRNIVLISAIVLNKSDNVATALRPLNKQESIKLEAENGQIEVVLSQPIPFGHKFALKDIRQGQSIIKYGEIIGLATLAIGQGQHVHVQNVEGTKGRGDKH
jgi:altronate dehydratase small subunit